MAWILGSEPGNPDEKQMEGVRTQSDTTVTTTTASCIRQVQQYQHQREFLEAETNTARPGNKAITDNEDNNTEKVEEEAFKMERKR